MNDIGNIVLYCLGRNNKNHSTLLHVVFISLFGLSSVLNKLRTLSSTSIRVSLLPFLELNTKMVKYQRWSGGFDRSVPSVSVMCSALKTSRLSQPHMLAGLFLLHYTGFLFFLLPSLSIFSSPAGQGSPAAARAHSSLPTFSSTCSYLAKPTGILKAWRRAICCPALHHFTPDPPSLCMHPEFFFFSFCSTAERWSKSWNGLAGKSQNHHLAEEKSCG